MTGVLIQEGDLETDRHRGETRAARRRRPISKSRKGPELDAFPAAARGRSQPCWPLTLGREQGAEVKCSWATRSPGLISNPAQSVITDLLNPVWQFVWMKYHSTWIYNLLSFLFKSPLLFPFLMLYFQIKLKKNVVWKDRSNHNIY